jgi:hypothetical protein
MNSVIWSSTSGGNIDLQPPPSKHFDEVLLQKFVSIGIVVVNCSLPAYNISPFPTVYLFCNCLKRQNGFTNPLFLPCQREERLFGLTVALFSISGMIDCLVTVPSPTPFSLTSASISSLYSLALT